MLRPRGGGALPRACPVERAPARMPIRFRNNHCSAPAAITRRSPLPFAYVFTSASTARINGGPPAFSASIAAPTRVCRGSSKASRRTADAGRCASRAKTNRPGRADESHVEVRTRFRRRRRRGLRPGRAAHLRRDSLVRARAQRFRARISAWLPRVRPAEGSERRSGPVGSQKTTARILRPVYLLGSRFPAL